ncbi:DUF3307 domain-containing protein [Actinokineospora inagensis]|uniref:DUF3307 domain-containing protein n=1 Tax=Actinokineospora inagensis TaxID=103730 RepID=UPI0003F4C89C|nr:DUF3307 domain-containing protein [Actinokineospora inagensis]
MSAVSATVLGAVAPALLVAHQVADHWVQTDHQATHKGHRGVVGRLACLRHVATYTATTALAVGVVWWLAGLPVHPVPFVAGQVLSALTHYWADRRAPLAWLIRVTGRARFAALGAPRPGRDDNPGLGTGMYTLDQSFHWLWLWVAALVTAVS